MKKNSPQVFYGFLKRHYMGKKGTEDVDVAIRDCLTDILHIAKKRGIPFERIHTRLNDALEVRIEETAEGIKL